MCLGGVRTSPVCALQVTAGEMPLWLRRKQLLANYWVNLMGQREDHPVRVATQASWERGVAKLSSFGWTGEVVAQELLVTDQIFCPAVLWPRIPLWQLDVPKVDVGLRTMKRIWYLSFSVM